MNLISLSLSSMRESTLARIAFPVAWTPEQNGEREKSKRKEREDLFLPAGHPKRASERGKIIMKTEWRVRSGGSVGGREEGGRERGEGRANREKRIGDEIKDYSALWKRNGGN